MIQIAPGDSIAALATPRGRGALALVRLSGPDAVSIADTVFRGQKSLRELGNFQGVLGKIFDGDLAVDEVIAWVYRAPHTFTGEDLVEFSCHGGHGLAERVLEALWRKGARPAGPGEFTRRAFLNGRVDLAQAEAVADLIAARGSRAQGQALAQLEGGLSRRMGAIGDTVRDVLARITVYLDFDEDIPEVPDMSTLLGKIREAQGHLRALLENVAPSNRLREGLRVVLMGRPNVGKSSLLNSLIGTDRALVHEDPGTTRDAVDVYVEWKGLAVHLFDTAGLREGDHPVERAGIDKTRAITRQADVVLWVVDGSGKPASTDHEIGRNLEDGDLYVVANKSDLGHADLEWVNVYSPKEICRVSALTGSGLDALKQKVAATGLLGLPENESFESVNERHAHLLEQALQSLERGAGALEKKMPAELAAADLSRCLEAMGEVLGEKAGPELLDTIFSRFCIGK